MYRMWRYRNYRATWLKRFFLIALAHNSLSNYYQLLTMLSFYHKYAIQDIEDMMPWEREVIVKLILHYIKQDEEARKGSEP